MSKPRCYHGQTTCGFCGPLARRLVKRRCACCGRFIAKDRPADSCPRCEARGFVALTLFTAAVA